MAVSGLLAQYLAVKNQLNYNHLQQTRWKNMATAMSKKLSTQTSAEEKWQSSSEAAYDGYHDGSKNLSAGGQKYLEDGNPVGAGAHLNREQLASKYADAAVPKFDSDLLEEYTELDMEYDTMQNMYNTLCEELEAQESVLREQLGTEAQNTHLLGN